MKQLLLVAVLASLASSALTLLVSGAFRPAPPPVAGSVTAADFKAALADLEREVAALRRETAERGAAVGPSNREAFVPPVAEKGAGEAPGPAAAAWTPEATAAHLQHFREIFPRDEEGNTSRRRDLLRRWMLHGEAEVIEWFGIPESVSTGDGQETWSYEIPTGEKDEEGNPMTESFQIQMSRGRLISIDG